MYQTEPPFDPRDFIRRFRASYINLYKLWTTVEKPPPGTRLETPAKSPIHKEDLPAAVRQLLEEFQKKNPKRELEFFKHMRTVNGQPVLVIEDAADLPEEDQLLTVSQTVTLNTSESVQIITDLFIARLQP